MDSDLKALSAINIIQICRWYKFACTRKKTDVQLSAEFENILQWAADNLMTVNINKTKEIVFHRPYARHSLPIPLIGIEQVLSAKLLGVIFWWSRKERFDYL